MEDDDPLLAELEALGGAAPLLPDGSPVAQSDLSDGDEDMLAGFDAAAVPPPLQRSGGVGAAGRGDRPGSVSSARRPWKEPRFVQRSQEDAAAAAASGSSEFGASTSPGAGGGDEGDSGQRSSSSAPRATSVPELYFNMNLDRASKARLLARGEVPPGIGGNIAGWGEVDPALTAATAAEYSHGMDSSTRLPQAGISVDYCIFCYHGSAFLGAEVRGGVRVPCVAQRMAA